jgi:phospholipase/carboxylesterase
MEDGELNDLVAVTAALLQSLEALGVIARYLNPPDLAAVMQAIGAPEEALRGVRGRLEPWPERLADVRASLESASDDALAAFDELRAALGARDGMRAVFRALRHAPRAHEALYPLAAGLAPVSRFFLDPASRDNSGLRDRLARAGPSETGVIHFDNAPRAPGGFSMYVPEYYTPGRAWPLVVALHGGSGNGGGFLWTWLPAARSRGAVLIAPTAVGETWALMGPDVDTLNLNRILDEVRDRWNIDPARLLLTGMSDGGTFTYVTGLEGDSPFTHLAPASAAFHPMLAQMAEEDRLRGLPIHIVHGALDWMFEVSLARQARKTLAAAGARVTYREIDDLSHCYPREVNVPILDWLAAT